MKIFCIGRNYVDHAKELGNEVPEVPVIFMKPKNALIQNHTPFYYPEFTNELNYEAELVLRINKNGRYIHPKQAINYINAISVGIDFTARDIQRDLKQKGLPWEKAKAFDNSAAIGVLKELTEEINLNNINFSLKKNGEIVQKGNTSDMIFKIADLISHISNFFSLNIGDLIYTGTPSGVGECVVKDKLEGYLESEKILDIMVR